ncbi:MAG: hypothetical protein ABWY27_16110 [Telluria sp.]
MNRVPDICRRRLLPMCNYKDKFGAAVGYLTAELSQVRLSKV